MQHQEFVSDRHSRFRSCKCSFIQCHSQIKSIAQVSSVFIVRAFIQLFDCRAALSCIAGFAALTDGDRAMSRHNEIHSFCEPSSARHVAVPFGDGFAPPETRPEFASVVRRDIEITPVLCRLLPALTIRRHPHGHGHDGHGSTFSLGLTVIGALEFLCRRNFRPIRLSS